MTDQFGRLAKTQTVSSLARRIATRIPGQQTFPDSLDLALAAAYDHHAVWGAGRGFVVKQEQKCADDLTRDYNKKDPVPGHERGSRDAFVKYESKSAYRNDNHHVQLGISPYHASNSRRGYNRGPDGCFYSA